VREERTTREAAARRGRRWTSWATLVAAVVMVSGGLFACVLVGCSGDDEGTVSTVSTATVETFLDMGSADPDMAAARSMVGYGLFAADQSGRFRPADLVTRAEFASLVVTIFELESTLPSSATFSDVARGNSSYAAIETAARYFVEVEGTTQQSQTFRPRDPISRGEAQKILRSLVQELAPDLAPKLPAGDAARNDQPLTRADAARLLIPVVEGRQPPAPDSFEPVGIN
jgi:hypothetical protein